MCVWNPPNRTCVRHELSFFFTEENFGNNLDLISQFLLGGGKIDLHNIKYVEGLRDMRGGGNKTCH